MLLAAAAIALIWANSPAGDSYTALLSTPVGPASIGPVPLDLDLPIGIWAADALLAIFFYIVGLELKHALVVGSLSRLREAVVPAAAALGGMIVPAVLFVMVNLTVAGGNTAGWG
ncbi:MAG: Na+/H+ antiporter NhaA, partial [Actinomycetales bacterium]